MVRVVSTRARSAAAAPAREVRPGTKGQETRSAVLGEAITQASVVGLRGVTIGTLASKAGLSKSGLFAHEESSLLTEERRLEEARLRLVAEVVRLYFERRRLQLERDARGGSDLATEARIAELGAMLDALTGGGMSQRE